MLQKDNATSALLVHNCSSTVFSLMATASESHGEMSPQELKVNKGKCLITA